MWHSNVCEKTGWHLKKKFTNYCSSWSVMRYTAFMCGIAVILDLIIVWSCKREVWPGCQKEKTEEAFKKRTDWSLSITRHEWTPRIKERFILTLSFDGNLEPREVVRRLQPANAQKKKIIRFMNEKISVLASP